MVELSVVVVSDVDVKVQPMTVTESSTNRNAINFFMLFPLENQACIVFFNTGTYSIWFIILNSIDFFNITIYNLYSDLLLFFSFHHVVTP